MGESMRKSKRFRPTLNDKLEDRTVPSLLFRFPPSQVRRSPAVLGATPGEVWSGGFGFPGGGDLVLTSSRAASQPRRALSIRMPARCSRHSRASMGHILAAVAALRQTATTTTGPTTAGLTAYDKHDRVGDLDV